MTIDASSRMNTSYPGTWLLQELQCRISHPIADIVPLGPTVSDSSGLEIVSPHNLMGRGNISQCNIDGIGKLQTSWIGQNGVCLNTVENLNASLVINFVTVA